MSHRTPNKHKAGHHSTTHAAARKQGTAPSSSSSPTMDKRSDNKSSVQFQVLLKRPSLDVTWGFLTYKNQWPLCIGSVMDDPRFAIDPASLPALTRALTAQGLLFTAPSLTAGGDANGVDDPAPPMPIQGLGVASLTQGDRILGLNGVHLKTREEANALFQAAELVLTMLVQRDTATASASQRPKESSKDAPIPSGSSSQVAPPPPQSRTPTAASSRGAAALEAAELLADLPRPAAHAGTGARTTTRTALAGDSHGTNDALPRPPSAMSASPATSTAARLGLPAPPPHSARPDCSVTSSSQPAAMQGFARGVPTPPPAERADEDESEEVDEAVVKSTRLSALTPVPLRASLQLLVCPDLSEDLPPLTKSGEAVQDSCDPMRPLYYRRAVPPTITSGHMNSDDANPTAHTDADESHNEQPCDVLGARSDRLGLTQRAAREAALRHALGSSGVPANAAVSVDGEARLRQPRGTRKDDEDDEEDANTGKDDSQAVTRAVETLPATVRSAVYDRSACPFRKEDGFTEEFHNAVQHTVTRLALHREDRLPTMASSQTRGAPSMHESGKGTVHQGDEVSAVDLLLNGRYDLVLYAQVCAQQAQARGDDAGPTGTGAVTASSSQPRGPATGARSVEEEDGGAAAWEEPVDQDVLASRGTARARVSAAHQACLAVMDRYATARRSEAARRQDATRLAHDAAERWRADFGRFMQKLAARLTRRRKSSPETRTSAGHSDDEEDVDDCHSKSKTPGDKKRTKKQRKRVREEHDRMEGGGAHREQQHQAYAAMAQLLAQLQGQTQGRHQGHTHPPVGPAYFQRPPYQQQRPQSPPPPERRLEETPRGAREEPTVNSNHHNSSRGVTAESAPSSRIYRPPQIPSTHGSTDHVSATRSEDGRKNAPTGRLGLPAPPPQRDVKTE